MRCEEACHWFKSSWIIWASNIDQVKEKEAHGNNLVQELVINVKFNKMIHHDFTSDIHSHTSGIHSSRSSATMVVPQVILNFKWSIQIEKAILIKKSSRFKWIDKCFDIGGGAPLHGIKVKDPTSEASPHKRRLKSDTISVPGGW